VSVGLGLQGPEKSLLGAQDLESTGGVLGQVGEGTSLLDQTRSHDLANQSRQVGGDGAHLLGQIAEEGAAVLGQLDDLAGKDGDVLSILVSVTSCARGAAAQLTSISTSLMSRPIEILALLMTSEAFSSSSSTRAASSCSLSSPRVDLLPMKSTRRE
jgi:hypothetical protein